MSEKNETTEKKLLYPRGSSCITPVYKDTGNGESTFLTTLKTSLKKAKEICIFEYDKNGDDRDFLKKVIEQMKDCGTRYLLSISSNVALEIILECENMILKLDNK